MMKKVLLSILLALLPLLANAASVEINGLFYNLTSDKKEASVVNPNGWTQKSVYTGVVTIPVSVVYNSVVYNVTSIDFYAFFNCTELTSVTIPNSVTSIGYCAFYGCIGLTSINIPDGVTSIDSEAFSGCSGLTSINIPSSVTSITGAFKGCSGLTSITVESANPQYDSRNNCNAIIETSSNTLIVGCKKTTIPNSVTSIDGAFEACTSLTSITIPNSVITIDHDAFRGCGLTFIDIPNSVTSIGMRAFLNCPSLSTVIIPNSVTSIEYMTFYNCGLTSVTIPYNVTFIDYLAFAHCWYLRDFYCWSNNVPSTNSDAFESTPCISATLHVPAGSVDAYKNTYPWSLFGEIVALTDDDPSPTGVNSLNVDNNINPEATFSLDGRRLSNPQRGLNIIRMSDGSTKKVMVK